ncbi:MAG: hypothetical protein JRH11_12470 [Deltaproteobacteria bacterium]|nr:hypothetical protein [Deltaproteobacteria bacterium]
MLERAALHQTRFRTPGVSPDARGVVLGSRGIVLFPSLDRLVAFLRAYGDEGSLDELLPGMEIWRLVTSLKTREILLSVQAESSYRMDRVAGVAKLAGGMVFTGTSRHFVKYRDPGSPLGYDVAELIDDAADVILYHDTFQQAYAYERQLAFRDLVLKLTPHRMPPDKDAMPTRLFATAETGIGGALVSYLFRWRVDARAALAEWPAASAFSDAPRRLYVFDMRSVPARVVGLMQAIPGVRLFEPLGETFAVELGFRHAATAHHPVSPVPRSTSSIPCLPLRRSAPWCARTFPSMAAARRPRRPTRPTSRCPSPCASPRAPSPGATWSRPSSRRTSAYG